MPFCSQKINTKIVSQIKWILPPSIGSHTHKNCRNLQTCTFLLLNECKISGILLNCISLWLAKTQLHIILPQIHIYPFATYRQNFTHTMDTELKQRSTTQRHTDYRERRWDDAARLDTQVSDATKHRRIPPWLVNDSADFTTRQ